MQPVRRRGRPELHLWAIALVAAGCSSFGTSVVGGDASVDGVAADAVLDADGGSADVLDAGDGGMDADGGTDGGGMDADGGDGTTVCTVNADCAGNPAGNVCDVPSGRCVQCESSADTCPVSQHCDDTSHTCVTGCRTDDGCLSVIGDGGAGDGGGGVGVRHCDTARHVCVQCVTDDQCPAGMQCTGNVCVMGCSATRACPAGQACCAGGCVNTQTNVADCGGCGTACAVPNAMPVCTAGACAVGTCLAPFADCDGTATNGCEVNTGMDVANCGSCGMPCPVRPHSTPTCGGGHCGFTCSPGFADCNGVPDDGCESDMTADPANCGGCGMACHLPNVAAATCAMSHCGIGMCAPGFADCDGVASNGCEVNLGADPTHCGSCARACPTRPNAAPACVGSACVQTCIAGFLHCSSSEADGCEVDDRTDARNCGGCGRVCAPANGTGMCVAGACNVLTCNPGFADCNGNPADGCETNTQTSTASCGACGHACAAGQVCSMGACTSTCGVGQTLCSGRCADLQTDAANCGACGHACPAGNACVAGTCSLVCPTGQMACGGLCVSTGSDPRNCGRCGNVCPTPPNALPTCTGTGCGFACLPGFADCDGLATNGCEVNTGTDINNCGGCGTRCAPTNASGVCTGGACRVAVCNTGFADCNGRPDDGCEVNLGTDAANCGACGHACPSGLTCAMSTCTAPPGTLDVTTPTVINTTAAAVTGAAGTSTVAISHTMGTFMAGQEVLIHQTQSPGSDAGQYEYNRVASVAGATVTLMSPLGRTFTTAGSSHAQMVVVGEYNTVIVAAGGSLTAPPWNGNTGGLLATDVRTSVTVNTGGTITMDGRGFRGASHVGCMPRHNCTGGTSGESVTGPGTPSLLPNSGGGGGGGQGQDCGAGAGGAYGAAGTGGSVGDCNGGTFGQCSLACPNPGGIAGTVNGTPNLGAAFYFGSAGGEGGGDEDGAYPGFGGNGGGAIVIRADSITVTGTITSGGSAGTNGNSSDCGIASGCGMGGGGGGSGGAVRILAATTASLGTGLVRAQGAGGGICSCGFIVGPERSWPAGRGGNGRVGVHAGTASGTTTPAFDPS